MPEHISRKELKTDEFRDTLAHGAEAVLSHQQLTIYVVAAIAIVATGGVWLAILCRAADGESRGGLRRCDEDFQGADANRGRAGRRSERNYLRG